MQIKTSKDEKYSQISDNKYSNILKHRSYINLYLYLKLKKKHFINDNFFKNYLTKFNKPLNCDNESSHSQLLPIYLFWFLSPSIVWPNIFRAKHGP